MAGCSPEHVVLSCEHGGREVPAAYRHCFEEAGELLDSHWAWDAGSAELAQVIGTALGVAPVIARITRLLVDLNRSPGHPRQFSEFTRRLSARERERIVAAYYRPHRERVEAMVSDSVRRTGRALHLSVHTFTPALNGRSRTADIALLYDPRRASELALCAPWARALAHAHPGLSVRRNYPYRGVNDGLTRYLRTRFPDAQYQGVELEVNQRLLQTDGRWGELAQSIAGVTREVLLNNDGRRPGSPD
jgi:predicted N-formylglutamate amidohydrolase